jgi:hypothetical protein
MVDAKDQFYDYCRAQSQEAFRLCLAGEVDYAQGILYSVRNGLKRHSGDLPIVGRREAVEGTSEAAFTTSTLAEARAWGWLELACGVLQLVKDHPGAALMHFTRAWRIWRLWSRAGDAAEEHEAAHERVRASLWLGEAWARFLSDRAERAANAILRAAYAEIVRIEAQDILRETLAQQALLPPAPPGSPAYNKDGRHIPYLARIL